MAVRDDFCEDTSCTGHTKRRGFGCREERHCATANAVFGRLQQAKPKNMLQCSKKSRYCNKSYTQRDAGCPLAGRRQRKPLKLFKAQ